MPNFALALPEIFVLCMACILLMLDLMVSDKNRVITYLFALLSLVGAAVITIGLNSQEAAITFNGTFITDRMAEVLKIFVYLVTAIVFIYARGYLLDRNMFKGEYYALGLFGVLGMMILISAHSFLTIYLGLELLSLSMYAMVAMHRDSPQASEAAMKFFVLGALASGMLLYGMSLLYGVTGTLDIQEFGQAISTQNYSQNVVLILGMVLVIVGLAFKLGAAPFHMWVPDIYHGAPTAVAIYIGTAPKLAAFAMVMRVLVEGLGEFQSQWQDILLIMAILSMGIGNVIAIAQTNIKRMLAYSTISHVGFLLLGILSGTSEGYSAAMYYTIVYSLMSLGGFGVILLMSRAGFEADKISDYKGLHERSPWTALTMLIIMFSMAGVPPTVGFFAKLSVLQAVVDIGLVWVAVVAVVFSIIGAFYYLRIIKLMYFDKPEDNTPISSFADMRIVLSANGLAILGLGLFPGSLLALCAASIN